ncbi:BQ2448_5313 [Microbotryum intermedium]|uniref:BQ2448_5313 protein n=1 Tax=Microbotryum intermedium TaxID=269621 RepID=A0A238F0N0_9BASI|nr:BQ2448_5313 [Microbotryum intermedium]
MGSLACSLVAYDIPVPRRGPDAQVVYYLDEISVVSTTLYQLDPAKNPQGTLQTAELQRLSPRNTVYNLPKVSDGPMQGKMALKAYLSDSKDYIDAIHSDVDRLTRYEKLLKELKKKDSASVAAVKSQVKAQRLQDITSRLVETGVDPRDVPVEHPFVNIARRLPKASWVTAKGRLLQAAEEKKMCRLREERFTGFAQRLGSLFVTQMMEHTLTLPTLNEVMKERRIIQMWHQETAIVNDASFAVNQDDILQVVIEFCVSRRLTYFCMSADALKHLRCGVDPKLFKIACTLAAFSGLTLVPGREPLSKEDMRVVDTVLADPHNHFVCCFKSWTYSELTVHVAEKRSHTIPIDSRRSWLNFDEHNDPYEEGVKAECSRDICRIVRDVAEALGINHPSSAALNSLGKIVTCSCGTDPMSWDEAVSHHLVKHASWHARDAWSGGDKLRIANAAALPREHRPCFEVVPAHRKEFKVNHNSSANEGARR